MGHVSLQAVHHPPGSHVGRGEHGTPRDCLGATVLERGRYEGRPETQLPGGGISLLEVERKSSSGGNEAVVRGMSIPLFRHLFRG